MKPSSVKRLLAALASLCMVATLGAPAVRAAETEPQTLEIATVDQLEALARDCRLDSWSSGRTVVLTADLDLGGSAFAGIPTFGGTLEGGGHTLSGLSLTSEGSVQGLFRYLQKDAVVEDLHLSGTVQPGGTRTTVGGLAGQNEGTIRNCSVNGTVTGTSQVGGIAGINTVTGVITGCTVAGSVYGDHFVGGLVGQNDGVISQCTNQAEVNTTVSQNDVKLDDLTVKDLLTTENAADITDIGGVAGNSTGVVRGCVNRGAVGYDHIGYNVGGIAGSQTGYVEGCVNYGTIHARKEGGGIVGQMEPSSVLQYSQDTLQQLQGELNTLQGLMNQATQDASASSSELNARFSDLQNRVDSARNAVESLLEQVKNGVNIGTQDLTVTALANLTGQGDAAGGAGAAVGGEAQGSGSTSTDVSVEAGDTATPTPQATPVPESTPVPTAEPTPLPTPEPTPEVTPEPTAPAESAAEQPDSAPAEEPASDRGEEAHGQPHRAPSLELEKQEASQAQAEAGAGLGLGGGVTAQGDATLDGQASVTVPDVELNNRDAITAARNSLSGSLTAIADGVDALNTDTGDHTQALIRDMEAITQQINKIGNTLLGAAENAGQGTLFEDVSDQDTDGDTEGKVYNCLNAGTVYADLNAGGITGAMARENDLDPEDDTKVSGSSSLNMTYQTRIVVRSCTNQGTVQAKKKCAGGIVGSMELGTVRQSCSTADLLEEDVDFVGGIAGQSKTVIRQCAAKGRISGDTAVGGIAGSGYTLTDCRAMVEVTGTEQVGAIAGTLLAEGDLGNTVNELQDNTSTVQNNCFVSDTLGGIDGVSYADQAEPMAYADFAALAREEGWPETFAAVTVTFVADGQTVACLPVEYGQTFDPATAPAVPEKAGCTGRWENLPQGTLLFDQTVTAVYTPYTSVVESADQRQEGRPVVLVDGSFGDGALTLTEGVDQAPAGTVDSWQFTLPDLMADGARLHYLPTRERVDLYLRDGEGNWRKAETTVDGSYLVCALQAGDNALAAVPQRTLPLPLLVLPGAALVLLAVLAVAARRRRATKTKY